MTERDAFRIAEGVSGLSGGPELYDGSTGYYVGVICDGMMRIGGWGSSWEIATDNLLLAVEKLANENTK